jgi:hypothetical protein
VRGPNWEKWLAWAKPTDQDYAGLLQNYRDLAQGVSMIRDAVEQAFGLGVLLSGEHTGATPVEDREAIATVLQGYARDADLCASTPAPTLRKRPRLVIQRMCRAPVRAWAHGQAAWIWVRIRCDGQSSEPTQSLSQCRHLANPLPQPPTRGDRLGSVAAVLIVAVARAPGAP